MTDYCGLDEFADAAGHLPPGAIDARRSYRGQVSALIIAAAAIATTALIGWTFSIEPMKRIAPGLTSMNPLTAVSLECASLTLSLLRDARPKGAADFLAMLLTIFVLLVGLSKMADLAFGTSLCPDAVLFAAQLNAGQEYPSRIAPQAAFCFAFMGAALLAIDRPRLPAILHPQLLAAPVLCLAIAGLVGYAYDTLGFYKFTSFIPMALHTATCFVLLASALILSRPDQGYLRLLPRGSPGARSFSRLLPVCLLVPACLAVWPCGGRIAVGSRDGRSPPPAPRC